MGLILRSSRENLCTNFLGAEKLYEFFSCSALHHSKPEKNPQIFLGQGKSQFSSRLAGKASIATRENCATIFLVMEKLLAFSHSPWIDASSEFKLCANRVTAIFINYVL